MTVRRLRVSWSMLGAFGAAALSSACCWLPLVLVLVGGSALGLAAVFARLRPLFLVTSGVFLAFAWYRVFFAAPSCCEDDAACERGPVRRRVQTGLLVLATAGVIAMAMFPSYAAHLAATSPPPTQTTTADVGGDGGASALRGDDAVGSAAAGAAAEAAGRANVVRLRIGGMTCDGCALGVARALERVEGVERAEVSYADARATVWLRGRGGARVDSLVAAVRAAGYDARPLDAP